LILLPHESLFVSLNIDQDQDQTKLKAATNIKNLHQLITSMKNLLEITRITNMKKLKMDVHYLNSLIIIGKAYRKYQSLLILKLQIVHLPT